MYLEREAEGNCDEESDGDADDDAYEAIDEPKSVAVLAVYAQGVLPPAHVLHERDVAVVAVAPVVTVVEHDASNAVPCANQREELLGSVALGLALGRAVPGGRVLAERGVDAPELADAADVAVLEVVLAPRLARDARPRVLLGRPEAVRVFEYEH